MNTTTATTVAELSDLVVIERDSDPRQQDCDGCTWLKELPEVERRARGKDSLTAQWRWPVGMPLCRAMGMASELV